MKLHKIVTTPPKYVLWKLSELPCFWAEDMISEVTRLNDLPLHVVHLELHFGSKFSLYIIIVSLHKNELMPDK